jgi:hypothetical protein
MKWFSNLKKRWKKWLENLAKANEKQFGHQPPSCCAHGKPVKKS